MPSKKVKSDLELLGIDLSASQMQTFQAVLYAAGSTRKAVEYDQIAEHLETQAGKKFTKAYVYRQLRDLEEIGLIKTDTIARPRNYSITESSVAKALESQRLKKISEYLTLRQDLTTNLNRLRATNPQDLAIMLHRTLVGSSSVGKSGVIEGVENVRHTIIREFADEAKEGDTVRILAHSSTIVDGLGPPGVTEFKILETGFRGVKVMGLLTPIGQDSANPNLMAGFLTPMIDIFDQVSKTGNIQLKISQEPANTYRMVSLNESKMLLYLTHAKESDMAALVHHEDNPGLIDDAIRTFDTLWETGVDVLDIVKQMLHKKSS
ncbi:MAG: transcriptional regulator [Candidatus Thorarchaeota archaeon]|nr:transcriptional regulator [Candidatus Thorarchaeota archaeon]